MDEAHEAVRTPNDEKASTHPLISVSDVWRRSRCDGGAPLSNVRCSPSGGAIFDKVGIPCKNEELGFASA